MLETSALKSAPVNHGNPASFLVSANAGLGVTEGVMILGDQHRQIKIGIDKKRCAAIGMISLRTVLPYYFCRHVFSILEMDETNKRDGLAGLGKSEVVVTLTAQRTGGS